jgi:hypothetical protein
MTYAKYITKTQGRDFNFFQKVNVTWSTFGGGSLDGYSPDIIITFSNLSVMMLNEATTGVVEFSLNGNTVHGELDASTVTKSLSFDNRPMSLIWFRLKSGTAGPVSIATTSWGIR